MSINGVPLIEKTFFCQADMDRNSYNKKEKNIYMDDYQESFQVKVH